MTLLVRRLYTCRNRCHLCSLPLLLCHLTGILGATQAEIEHHLEMGRKLLAAGQLAEALSHYHSAVGKTTRAHTPTFVSQPREIFPTDASASKGETATFSALGFTEGDAKNYLTFYKRAAVFLAMGKSKSALPDLTRAIQLKPDFLAVSFPPFQTFPPRLQFSLFIHFSFRLFYVSVLLGQAAEREHPFKAGKRTRSQGGL